MKAYSEEWWNDLTKPLLENAGKFHPKVKVMSEMAARKFALSVHNRLLESASNKPSEKKWKR